MPALSSVGRRAGLLLGVTCTPLLLSEASTKGAVQIDAFGALDFQSPPALEDGVQGLVQQHQELVAHSKAAAERSLRLKEEARQAQVEVDALQQELLEAQIQVDAARGFTEESLAHADEGDEVLSVLFNGHSAVEPTQQRKPQAAGTRTGSPTATLIQMEANTGQTEAKAADRASGAAQLEAATAHLLERRDHLNQTLDSVRALARSLAADLSDSPAKLTQQDSLKKVHAASITVDAAGVPLSLLQVGSTKHDAHDKSSRKAAAQRTLPSPSIGEDDETSPIPAALGDSGALGGIGLDAAADQGSDTASHTSVFEALSSKVASLEQRISETELRNRQAYEAHKAVYEEELRKRRTANAEQKAKNEAAARELEQATQRNVELRKKAEGLRDDIKLWEKDLLTLKGNISTALEFTAVAFEHAAKAHASEDVQVLQDLALADAKDQAFKTQRERLRAVAAAGGASLLQTNAATPNVSPGLLKSLNMDLDSFTVEHQRREDQLKEFYAKLFSIEAQKKQGLLNESQELALAKARVEETGQRLIKAIAFLEQNEKQLEENARSVRTYAQRLGLRPPPVAHRRVSREIQAAAESATSSADGGAAESSSEAVGDDRDEGTDGDNLLSDSAGVAEGAEDAESHGELGSADKMGRADKVAMGILRQAAAKGLPGATIDDRAAESVGIAAPGAEASETTHALARAAATVAHHAASGANEAIKKWPSWWSMLPR